MEEKKELKPAEPEAQDGKAQECKLQDEDLDGVAGGGELGPWDTRRYMRDT